MQADASGIEADTKARVVLGIGLLWWVLTIALATTAQDFSAHDAAPKPTCRKTVDASPLQIASAAELGAVELDFYQRHHVWTASAFNHKGKVACLQKRSACLHQEFPTATKQQNTRYIATGKYCAKQTRNAPLCRTCTSELTKPELEPVQAIVLIPIFASRALASTVGTPRTNQH